MTPRTSAARRRPAEPRRAGATDEGGAGLSGDVRSLLRRHGLAPNRRLGQNFLVDTQVLQQILAAARVDPAIPILEIGPGLGILTEALAGSAPGVVAIELDTGLVGLLRDRFRDDARVKIVSGDALQIEVAELLSPPYHVVANIPYYLTSSLLRRFLEARPAPQRITVMVQREVAERIASQPPHLSMLAVSVQYYGDPRIAGIVPADAFYPRPDVDSAILTIDVLPTPRVDVPPDPFFKTVAAGFAMPRKQLHNALARAIWFPPGGAVDALAEVGIDPTRRAQTVTLSEWALLARVLASRGAL